MNVYNIVTQNMENKYDLYRGKDCIKTFCEYLREHAMEIIYSKKKEMKLSTNKEQKSYKNAKNCYISKNNL